MELPKENRTQTNPICGNISDYHMKNVLPPSQQSTFSSMIMLPSKVGRLIESLRWEVWLRALKRTSWSYIRSWNVLTCSTMLVQCRKRHNAIKSDLFFQKYFTTDTIANTYWVLIRI